MKFRICIEFRGALIPLYTYNTREARDTALEEYRKKYPKTSYLTSEEE